MKNKQAKCPWKLMSKVFLIPMSVFIVLLIGALMFDFVLGVDVPVADVYFNFLAQGAMWFLISMGFLIFSMRGNRKLRRLKEEGICYDGAIEDFRYVYGVRLMHYATLKADCSYNNHEGKKCLVRSKAFYTDMMLATLKSHFQVKVYVNRYDPTDYAVEIFEQEGERTTADYDFR